jgi:hypothetical protein
MLDKLRAAAEHMDGIHKKIRESAASVRSSNAIFPEALERQLLLPVAAAPVNGSVCAIDGGLLSQELHGIDLVIGKAVAVVMNYQDGKLISTTYSPSAFPEPTYEVRLGLDEREIQIARTLFRLDLEISCAIEAVEKHKPKILLLDGSIVPLATDRPAEDSETYQQYSSLISKYNKLYSLCSSTNTLPIGITKDSRGRRFMDVVRKEVDQRWSDSVFLSSMLKGGERTFAMRYSSSPQKHAVLKDLGGAADKISLFYIKCFDNERPLRVEFLEGQATYSEIAASVHSLAAINSSYAYPAALIEADLRAAMDPIEMERAQRSLQSLSGSFEPLRRNSRPFR